MQLFPGAGNEPVAPPPRAPLFFSRPSVLLGVILSAAKDPSSVPISGAAVEAFQFRLLRLPLLARAIERRFGIRRDELFPHDCRDCLESDCEGRTDPPACAPVAGSEALPACAPAVPKIPPASERLG
jgi:hypothetical protein